MTSDGPPGPGSQGEGERSGASGQGSPGAQDARTWNEIGGTIYGPSVMARDVRGDLHVHHVAPPASHPATPPPSQLPQPTQLTGRARELEKMDTARASRVIVLTGQPGVGKTSLAIHWGHRVRSDFPDGVLYADLHGYAPDGPASPAEELARFLRALGVPPQQVPADLAELTALFRSLMADRGMLVVLDDALTAAQVIPLLPPSSASVAVVTSRSRLGGLVARGARVVQLDPLDADSALELLARTLGDDRVLAEPYAARELVELCARPVRGRGSAGRASSLGSHGDGPRPRPRKAAAGCPGLGGRHGGAASAGR
jgi:hypothetical protein